MSFKKCLPVLVFSLILITSIFGFFPKQANANWEIQSSAGSRSWSSVSSSSDGTKLAAAVNGGYIYISTDSGATWIERKSAGSKSWVAITSSSDGTKLAAVVDNGYIYTSGDSGVTWVVRSATGNNSWSSISSSSDGTKLAAAVNGYYIYTSTDSGATWTQRTSSGSRSWTSITSSSDGTKLAAVDYYGLDYNGGYLYTSTDGGASWTERTSLNPNYWLSIASSSDGTKLVVAAESDYLYTSADSGATWTKRGMAGSTPFVSSSSDGITLVKAIQDNYLYISTDSGLTFTKQSAIGSHTWSSVVVSSDGTKIVAVVNGGFIYHFSNITPVLPIVLTSSPSFTQTNATLSGNITNSGMDIVSARGFQYGATISYGLIATESGSFGSGVFSKNITSLVPNTTYHYRSYATNSIGTSYGEDQTFTTLTSDKPILETYGETLVSNNSVTLNGNILDIKGDNVTIRGFQYGVTTEYGTTTVESGSFGIGNYSKTITSLTPNSTYHYRAYATNSIGTGYGQDITFNSTQNSWFANVSTQRNWSKIVSSSDGTKLMAISNVSDYIYVSKDSGITWTSQAGPGAKSWTSIATSSDGNKLFASGGNTFYSSIDGGTTWIQQTNIGSKTFQSIASSADGVKLVASVWNGYLYNSTDSGVTWTERTSAGSLYWYSVASSADGVKLVAALGAGGSLYTSSDGGANWIIQTGAGSYTWRGISSSSDGTKLIAGSQSGYLYISRDSGITWQGQTSLGSSYWLSVASSSDGMKLAAVDDSTNGYIYTSSDGGVTWVSQVSAGGRYWQSITSSSDGTKLFAVSDYVYIYGPNIAPNVLTNSYTGNILSTTLNGFASTSSVIRGFQYGFDTNYGTNITESGTFGAGSFSANVTSFLPNLVYHYRAFATNGMGTSYSPDVILKFDIKPFISQTNSGIKSWYSLASSSDGIKLAAANGMGGADDYIYTSTDSGVTWTQQLGSGIKKWTSITSSSDGTKLAAVAYSGYIYTSIDSGVTWVSRTSSGSKSWQSITSSSDGTKLAAVVYGGYIYTSIDSGVTWTQRTNDIPRDWTSIASSSDGIKLVASTGGPIYTSTDSGITWVARSGSGKYVASSSDGTKLAAVVNGGYISTSIDSGLTWVQQNAATSRKWYAIASSADGTKLAAIDNYGITNGSGDYIYTSSDSGLTWTAQTGTGIHIWYSIASSSDGTKLVAGSQNSFIYTSSESASSLPVLTTSPASSVLQYTATLNGYINNIGGSYNTVRGFEYGLTTGYGTTTTENGSFNIGNFSSNITSLIPNTTYHYRSYSTNPAGTSYGQDSTFATLNLVAPSLETHGEIIVNGNSATLHGAITFVGGNNSTFRGFQYGLTTEYGNTTTESGSFGLGNFSANIASLNAGSTYHYRSYATNSAGTSYGLDKTFIATPNIYSWTSQLNSGYHSWTSITSSSDGTKLVAIERGGYIYTSTDSGVNWIQRTSSGIRSWTSIASSSDGSKLASVVFGGYIYTSNDSGATWTERVSAGSLSWTTIVSSSDGTKLAATVNYNGYIYTSNDSGATWIVQTNAGSRSWASITSSSDGTKLAAASNYNGYIYTSADSGATWTERTSAGSRYWASIASSSDGTKLVASVGSLTTGYIYTSTDSGATWTERTSAGSRSWISISSSSDGTKLVAADSWGPSYQGGYIYTSVDSGATWISQTSIGLQKWNKVSISSYGTKIASIYGSGYIQTYGILSIPTPTNSAPNITGDTTITLNGYSNTDSIIRGFEYGLTTSYGTTITQSGSFNLGSFSSNLTGLNPGATYHYRTYATNSTGTGYSTDSTFVLKLQGWISQTSTGSHNWTSLSSSSDGTKLAAISDDHVYTSINNGDTWTMGSLIYADSITLSSDGSKIVAVSIGSRGDVNISNDSGKTWNLNNYINNFLQSVVLSSDGTKIVIGSGSGGRVYISNDSGATWISRSIPGTSVYVTSSSDGTKLAAVANNTNVYTSTDGGLTWISRTSSGVHNWFSIASSSDGMKLVAVGTGIYTSTDGGVSWVERIASGSYVWRSVASSSDGVNLITGTEGGYIYTSSDSGVNWSSQDNVGMRNWYSVYSSSDGMKLFAADYGGYIYTYSSAPVINTEPASILSETSAVLNASITNAGKVSPTIRGFEYGLDTNYTKNTEEVGSFTEGTFSANIMEVQPGNTYHYRSYAKNSAGTGYGNDLTFTTNPIPVSQGNSGGSTLEFRNKFIAEQKALAEGKPTTTVTPPTVQGNALSITKTLKLKVTSNEVKELQKYLNTKGYTIASKGPGSLGNETTYFGPATKKAVISFQKANKLKGDGIVGPGTIKVMNSK